MTFNLHRAQKHAPFDQNDFDTFLDEISTPFLTRDITLWLGRMQLPFSMITAQGPVLLNSEQDVKCNFDYYLVAVDAMKLDAVVRSPISIETCDAQTVIVTYRTELLNNGTRQAEPYTSSALLHLTPEGWKMSSIMNARGHHPWTGQHPRSNGDDT